LKCKVGYELWNYGSLLYYIIVMPTRFESCQPRPPYTVIYILYIILYIAAQLASFEFRSLRFVCEYCVKVIFIFSSDAHTRTRGNLVVYTVLGLSWLLYPFLSSIKPRNPVQYTPCMFIMYIICTCLYSQYVYIDNNRIMLFIILL